ncbi:MAG: hypothetical protein KDC44_12850 [Phaeodactylibacter sp.]|nr:hypothetical protein [Phaeodactylibacter sp.]
MKNALIIAFILLISSLVVQAWTSNKKGQDQEEAGLLASSKTASQTLKAKRTNLEAQLKLVKQQVRNQFILIQNKMKYAPRSVRAAIKAQSEQINERHEQLKADLHRIDQTPEAQWATFEARALENMRTLQQEIAAHFERLEVKHYLTSL